MSFPNRLAMYIGDVDLLAAASFNWYIRKSEQVTLKAGT